MSLKLSTSTSRLLRIAFSTARSRGFSGLMLLSSNSRRAALSFSSLHQFPHLNFRSSVTVTFCACFRFVGLRCFQSELEARCLLFFGPCCSLEALMSLMEAHAVLVILRKVRLRKRSRRRAWTYDPTTRPPSLERNILTACVAHYDATHEESLLLNPW